MVRANYLLFKALSLNAAFSAGCALIMLVAGGWLAEQFALESGVPIYAIAGFLVVFALQLGNIVRTGMIRIWEIKGIISGDIAWVIASMILIILYYQTFTAAGLMLLDVVAVVVLVFAILQIRGLRQLRRMVDANRT
jgi:hypothetical protein